ncbi:PAS domain S-box protein [Sporolactobacillus nakayamae]|nr:PAS domain S-box protein [Sporolactobacillus nakayamae]
MTKAYKQMLPVGVAYQELIFDAAGKPCDFVFLQTNTLFNEMIGMKDVPIIGKRYTEIMHGVEYDLVQQFANIALHGGTKLFEITSTIMDHRYKVCAYSFEKNKFWTNVIDMAPDQDSFLELQKIIGLTETNDHALNHVLDHFSLPITIISLDGTILYLNHGAEKLFAVDSSAVNTEAGRFFADPKDIDTFIIRIDSQKVSQGDEVRLKTSGGKRFWSKCDSVRFDYRNSPCILSVHQDITKQKQLEYSAAKSKENYHLLFDNVSEAIVIAQNGYVKMCNHYVREISKYSESYLFSTPFEEIVVPQDRERLMKNHYKQMRGERSGSFSRFRITTADGELRWIAMKSVRIDWEGKPASLNFLNDITEKMHMVAALESSEEKFKFIFENAAEAILIIQDNRIRIANPMTVRYSGYSLTELLTMDISRMIFREDRVRCIQAYQERLRSEAAIGKIEFRVVRRDGSIIWVQAVGAKVAWEGHMAVQYFVNDITDQKKAEQDREASELKYQLIAESASDVIWVYNYTRHCFAYISPAVKSLRNLTPERAEQMTLEETFAPESLHLLRGMVEEKIKMLQEKENGEGSNTFIKEMQQYCADGHLVWTEASIRLRLNNRNEYEVFGVSRNIEERKKSEESIIYLSFHDQLTGLYNRRFYDEELMRLEHLGSSPMTLVLADVNGLKLTNDAFGHQAGDDLLVAISQILREESKEGDIIARVGGDEFVMIWPRNDELQTERRINHIHDRLLSSKSVHHTILSVSFGWAVRKSKKETMTYIFTEAENNMYQHKLFEGNSMRSRTINMITNTLYAKLPSEERHARRVSKLCMEIGQRLGMDANDLNELRTAGLLHDIGKIAIEESLFKKEHLTEAEWSRIRLHPEKGYHILKLSNEFMSISQYILCHHERIDGTGYPLGLKGDQIPLPSRIISIVGAFDAMVADQPYRKKIAQREAIEILKKNAGTQFDPVIVDTFVTEVLVTE